MEFESKSYWGNLNAIVLFENEQDKFHEYYDMISNFFPAKEYIWTSFDTVKNIPMEFQMGDEIIQNALIRKVIFSYPSEQIILENYRDTFAIEHTFHYDGLYRKGVDVIRKLLRLGLKVKLVLGFETSLHVDAIDESLEEISHDTSGFPLILQSDNQYQERVAHPHDQRLKVLREYYESLIN